MYDKKLYILDLDETLIHSSETKNKNMKQFKFHNYFVNFRPYLNDLIQFIEENHHLAFWTSSTKSYAEPIIHKIINKSPLFIKYRIDCTLVFNHENKNSIFKKDTLMIEPQFKRFKSVYFIDDKIENVVGNHINKIKIKPFIDDINDKELFILLEKIKLNLL